MVGTEAAPASDPAAESAKRPAVVELDGGIPAVGGWRPASAG